MSNIGVPTKLLQESLGHVVTVELKSGQVYRGKLFEGGFRMSRLSLLMSRAGYGMSRPRLTLYCACCMRVAHRSAAEDNLNVSMKDITVTQRDGRVTQLDQVYIRGPMIRFYIVPDMLANAPMCVTWTWRSCCSWLWNS